MDTPLFEQPESCLEEVALADIQPWSASGAKSVTAKSIGTLGLRNVVMLARIAPGSRYRFRVIDGNRRLDQALAQGNERVRAEVMPEGTSKAEAAGLRLSLNMSRAANPLQEAEAIRELREAYLAEGVPEADILGTIGKAFGVRTQKLAQRLGLIALSPALRQGVEQGKVAPGVAGKIANLSLTQQEQLAHDLVEKGKLTARDVKEVRRVKQEAVLAELPDTLFAPLETPIERARVVLKEFLAGGVGAAELVSLIEVLELERTVV